MSEFKRRKIGFKDTYSADDTSFTKQYKKLELTLSPLPSRGFTEAVKLTPNMSSMDPAPSSKLSKACRPAARELSTAHRSVSVNYTILCVCMSIKIQMGASDQHKTSQ